MKKHSRMFSLALGSLLVMSTVLLGCGGSSSSNSAPAGEGTSSAPTAEGSAKKIVFKLAHVQPESHPFHKGSVKFAEVLKEVSGGQMEVEVFSSGSLGNERDLLEGLQMGSVDVVTTTSALTGRFNPEYQVFSLPFLFGSYEDAFAAMDNPAIQDKLHPPLIQKGIRPIAYWIGGARSYYGTTPVNGIEDLRGKKVRTLEDPYYIKTWEVLGATPTPLPFGEVYTGLETKLINGAEGAINTYLNSKFNEVASSVAFINYVYSAQLLHMSEATWSKLNSEQQGWVEQAAKASAEYERQLILEEEKSLEQKLAELNVTVTHPQADAFREAVTPVYEMFRKEFGEDAYKLVEEIRKR
ncbi:TRAP transporter substrate-binding protein [Ammoniphilus sp. YIM 78166]|uniref:TRAP transporter substrate-binding protein n=1 Tax=Ammoniphilus sp. YIM 78166 TaxID=1644106 RepID=UPI00106F875F|nr:TRAP transporter substrate-binding protein [Ammoniphilus sp. YIM 78166]